MAEPLFATRSVSTTSGPEDAPAVVDGQGGTQPEIVVPPSAGASTYDAASQAGAATPRSSSRSEPLARIEDKTSRIEEKLARSEASMQRVVDKFEVASARMNEVALQSELAAVRGEVAYVARRVRGVPGVAALLALSVVTAVLSAVAVVLVMKYLPGLAPSAVPR